jgi:hypothetical protein
MHSSLSVLVLAMAVGCGEVPVSPVDGGVDGPSGTPVTPVAPSAGKAMYQGQQRLFKTTTGATCAGRVAASMAGTGFCYLAADDNVKCAGLVGETTYGMTLAPIGVGGVEQILLMFLDNGMCVTKTDHTALCKGTNLNALGTASPSFTRWTARSDLAALGSGTWDQICGITMTGQVYCGGTATPTSYGQPAVAVGTAGQTGLWVDTLGVAKLSDATVVRPAESRTDCQITTTGMKCGAMTYGPTNGTVVSGTLTGSPDAPLPCWLTDNGSVTCSDGPRFAAGKVLLLAANSTTDSMCAIYNDGAVWCIGSNSNGKLGTGTTTALAVETLVAAPGSARVRCE